MTEFSCRPNDEHLTEQSIEQGIKHTAFIAKATEAQLIALDTISAKVDELDAYSGVETPGMRSACFIKDGISYSFTDFGDGREHSIAKISKQDHQFLTFKDIFTSNGYGSYMQWTGSKAVLMMQQFDTAYGSMNLHNLFMLEQDNRVTAEVNQAVMGAGKKKVQACIDDFMKEFSALLKPSWFEKFTNALVFIKEQDHR